MPGGVWANKEAIPPVVIRLPGDRVYCMVDGSQSFRLEVSELRFGCSERDRWSVLSRDCTQ